MLTIAFCVLAFIFSSFVEYWIHRFMHVWPWFGNRLTSHYKHHYDENAQVLGDFKDYSMVAAIFLPIFFISWSIAISAIFGGLVFAAFAAYTHKLQHNDPAKCFWMKVPVHYLHHKYTWNHNFGLSVDWWDRVFGTYKPMEWSYQKQSQPTHRIEAKLLSTPNTPPKP
jgi:sterol desaturase/sphingolipid hydroxylase (fatty acid hydroxylase superfamily)